MKKISSTRIRNELDSGNVSEVERLLGYSYRLSGTVIHGDARGRLIGYPTANVSPTERFFIPKTGVYVVTLSLGDETFTGMANVGFKRHLLMICRSHQLKFIFLTLIVTFMMNMLL